MVAVEITSPRRRKRRIADSPPSFQEERGFFCLRPLDPDAAVLTCSTPSPAGPIRLHSNRVYTVGRERRLCDVTFPGNRHISRQHCQFLLDGCRRRLVVVDGVVDPSGECLPERCSTNGVFVNGRRIEKGTVFELGVGDEVVLACGGFGHAPGARYGFSVEKIEFLNACRLRGGGSDDFSTELIVRGLRHREPMERAWMLLSMCRRIRESVDPISYIHQSLDIDCLRKKRVMEEASKRSVVVNMAPCGLRAIDLTHELPNKREQKQQDSCIESGGKEYADGGNEASLPMGLDQCPRRNGSGAHPLKEVGREIPTDGSSLFLNRLHFMDPKSPENQMTVSLPELMHPIGSLVRVFIATLTCDVLWFLSYCKIPNHLPVTIACHDAKRCWDASSSSRMSKPFSEYPNLVVIYPPFPESIAFGMDRKKRGVGCHHPKLIILQREETMRIIITSANLVSRQWNNITNTVWWQDFPRRHSSDFSHIFSHPFVKEKNEDLGMKSSDFASYLAGFIASLVADVPQEAYWIPMLTKYDFGGAAGHLVASVPGIHVQSRTSRPKYILSLSKTLQSQYHASNFVGCVQASVVGITHRYHTATDSNGSELKTLASLLQTCHSDASMMLEVMLRRETNIPADPNAVSVLVSDINELSEGATVQLGFLPRDVAKWVAPLSDQGLFSFSAFIFPREALAAAFEGVTIKVQLILHVTQGPGFSNICQLLQPELHSPLCLLVASLGRCVGLSRLQEILCHYSWPESSETDFVYGCSSIGTSICPQYLASFSAAAGKRSHQFSDSESDPEWGCWTTEHELRKPSIDLLFPTIQRVKDAPLGLQFSRWMLAFSEKTWQRLRSTSVLHDAVPSPQSRLGYPMHVKVARRRFRLRKDLPSFGWIYCGSHNFSPAAWGQPLQGSSSGKLSGVATSFIAPKLHICNYELGIIFIVPPKLAEVAGDNRPGLDDFILPFVVPAPRYTNYDRPATAQAMREASLIDKEIPVTQEVNEEELEEESSDEEGESVVYVAEENNDEKIYAEMLWSQLESSSETQ